MRPDRRVLSLDEVLHKFTDSVCKDEQQWEERLSAVFAMHAEEVWEMPDGELRAGEEGSEEGGERVKVVDEAGFKHALEQAHPGVTDEQASTAHEAAARSTRAVRLRRFNKRWAPSRDATGREFWVDSELQRTQWAAPSFHEESGKVVEACWVRVLKAAGAMASGRTVKFVTRVDTWEADESEDRRSDTEAPAGDVEPTLVATPRPRTPRRRTAGTRPTSPIGAPVTEQRRSRRTRSPRRASSRRSSIRRADSLRASHEQRSKPTSPASAT